MDPQMFLRLGDGQGARFLWAGLGVLVIPDAFVDADQGLAVLMPGQVDLIACVRTVQLSKLLAPTPGFDATWFRSMMTVGSYRWRYEITQAERESYRLNIMASEEFCRERGIEPGGGLMPIWLVNEVIGEEKYQQLVTRPIDVDLSDAAITLRSFQALDRRPLQMAIYDGIIELTDELADLGFLSVDTFGVQSALAMQRESKARRYVSQIVSDWLSLDHGGLTDLWREQADALEAAVGREAGRVAEWCYWREQTTRWASAIAFLSTSTRLAFDYIRAQDEETRLDSFGWLASSLEMLIWELPNTLRAAGMEIVDENAMRLAIQRGAEQYKFYQDSL